jgi:hypothetical protein
MSGQVKSRPALAECRCLRALLYEEVAERAAL